MMKALTIWQPWASLVMIGAKPFEFRKWDYRERSPSLEGQRIVIHAGARPIKPTEVDLLIGSINAGESSLIAETALPLLRRVRDAFKCRGVLELSAALGTVKLGKPRKVGEIFRHADSDRLNHHLWAWPMLDVQPFREPIPMRGAQGFFNVDIRQAA